MTSTLVGVWALGFVLAFFPLAFDCKFGVALAGATFWPFWLFVLTCKGTKELWEQIWE